ncbi:MAG: efflux RND transporter periplasmic adaptor subunit [Thermodesulfobacteriota bacterium]
MFYRKSLLILAAAFFLAGCGAPGDKTKDKNTAATAEKQAPEIGSRELITIAEGAVKNSGLEMGKVFKRRLLVNDSFSGLVSVDETRIAHVGPRIAGRAVEVNANLGDFVKKGRALAIIDSTEIGEAQSQYLKAGTNFVIAEKSYERAKIILKGKVISTGEFQRREGRYLSAKTELKATEDRLHILGMSDVEIAAIGKEHTINSRVAIYAPLSGKVIERHLTLGEVVEPVKSIYTIADLTNLWVLAEVPERDIPRIKKGQDVAVSVLPYPKKVFPGVVTYVSDLIDADTRMVKVRAEVDNSDGLLKPGMFATVSISAPETDGVLVVPEGAVQRDGKSMIVFVKRGASSFEKRTVELGPSSGGFHPVISGLVEGETIVTKGAFTLKSEEKKSELAEE